MRLCVSVDMEAGQVTVPSPEESPVVRQRMKIMVQIYHHSLEGSVAKLMLNYWQENTNRQKLI